MQNTIFETIYVMFWQDLKLSTMVLNLKLMKLIFTDDPKLLKNRWLKRQASFYVKGKTTQQLEKIRGEKVKQSWIWWWILDTTQVQYIKNNKVGLHYN